MFRDRPDAGAQLAGRLEHLRGQDVLVLGIPRGGVPVAAEIATRLAADLDIVVARKLGAPYQPELAIGAVSASGGLYLNERVLEEEPYIPGHFLRTAIAHAVDEARQLEERLRGGRPPPRIARRTVIIVDDGLATGATMRAAVRALRDQQPGRIVVAVPVAPPATVQALQAEADEVIAMEQPDPFLAVGLHYEDFKPTPEAEIERLLESPGSSH
jgi:predicted phosphoribosyltransferase